MSNVRSITPLQSADFTPKMSGYKTLQPFRYWCQKVLPLVYDDSLSYYEILCKVAKYINDLIDSDKEIIDNIEELKKDMNIVQKWINEFDTKFIEEVVRNYLATMIFVTISDSGYFIYHIPKSWKEIEFKTTGFDVFLEMQPEYGHLVLYY